MIHVFYLVNAYEWVLTLLLASGAVLAEKSVGPGPLSWRAREPEPIKGVWGLCPQRGSRGRAPGGGSGAKPPEVDDISTV